MITCIGTIIADILIKPVDRLPGQGELSMTEKIQLSPGGSAANTSVMLARTGSKVSLLGTLGNDSIGEYLMREYQKELVRTDGIKIFPATGSTAIIVCINSKGERSFIAKYDNEYNYSLEHIRWEEIKKSRHLHFGGFYTFKNLVGANAAALFKKAKNLGLTTSLDTIWDHTGKWLDNIRPCLPYVDFLMTNREEGLRITTKSTPKEISKSLIDAGANTVVVKLDKDGSLLHNTELDLLIPPYPAAVMDNTGAGDAFSAGFITGLMKKLPLYKCCKLGNAFGSLNVRAMGATGGIQSWDQITTFLKESDPELGKLIG